MTFVNTLIMWREKLGKIRQRHINGFNFIVGISLMLIAYFLLGRIQIPLLLEGARTEGVIVDYNQVRWRSADKRNVSASMPVVEFTVDDQTIRFQNWLGTNIASGKNTHVPVIYDPKNPSRAMIDKPGVWNYLPWGPFFFLGLFISLVAIKNWLVKLLRS